MLLLRDILEYTGKNIRINELHIIYIAGYYFAVGQPG